jgi:hypothetical protein
MTTIHAQLILAITILENVSTLLLTLMTTTNAPLIIAMLPMERFTTMQLFVMTTTHALTNLAILKLDVSTPMLEQNTVMTTMFVPLMDAQVIRKNVFTLLLIAMTTILALLILVILSLDANMLLCPPCNLMTTMHVLVTTVLLKTESNMHQSLAITETNARLDLVML